MQGSDLLCTDKSPVKVSDTLLVVLEGFCLIRVILEQHYSTVRQKALSSIFREECHLWAEPSEVKSHGVSGST